MFLYNERLKKSLNDFKIQKEKSVGLQTETAELTFLYVWSPIPSHVACEIR